APEVRRDAAGARRPPGLPRARAVRARAGSRRLVHPAEPGERPLLALELLGPALHGARGPERHLGLPRGRERGVIADDTAVRREPVLRARREPLDRDAAGADRDDHRRRVRVPSEAPGGIPRSPELLGPGTALPHRVGLPAVSRLARALS